jgi:N-methylhydantoinase B
MMLIAAGTINETLIEMIRNNVRIPDHVLGDLWAQVSANRMLAQRLLEMLDETECDLVEVGKEMYARSESAMRGAIQTLPDGDY